jgi:hypothetical protein
MGEKEAFDAQQQSRREVASGQERPAHHEDAIRTYLAGFAYAESCTHAVPRRTADKVAREPAVEQVKVRG